MRRSRSRGSILCAGLAVLLFSSGCFTTHLAAPEGWKGEAVILSDGGSEAEFDYRKDYRNWYLLFGIVPMITTQPEEIVAEQSLREVRVQTQDTAVDALIAILLGPLTILPQSVTVEGNR